MSETGTPKLPELPERLDVSQEFNEMDVSSFLDHLRWLTKQGVKELSIVTDWKDIWQARRLKAFLESAPQGQKRATAIRATEQQKMQEPNVFASGVRWIPVESPDVTLKRKI